MNCTGMSHQRQMDILVIQIIFIDSNSKNILTISHRFFLLFLLLHYGLSYAYAWTLEETFSWDKQEGEF